MYTAIDILKASPEIWAIILVVLVLLSPLIAWIIFQCIVARFYDMGDDWLHKDRKHDDRD